MTPLAFAFIVIYFSVYAFVFWYMYVLDREAEEDAAALTPTIDDVAWREVYNQFNPKMSFDDWVEWAQSRGYSIDDIRERIAKP